MKLKYHKVLSNHHYYQRKWPKRLEPAAKVAGLQQPLVRATGLDQYAPLSSVEAALDKWNGVYEDMVTMLERSSSEELEVETRTRLVQSFIEARGLTVGQFASLPADDDTDTMWNIIEGLFGDDLEQDHPDFKREGRTATYSREFITSAIGLLQAPVEKRITFTEAVNSYLTMRKKKTGGDRLKKEISYCNRFITAVGDHLLTTENAGRYLKQYRTHLLEDYKPPTAARMLSSPKAALSHAADTLVTDVFIPQVKVVGSTKHDERYTLSEAEMVHLIDLVTTPECPMPDYVRLFYLVAVHAGAHMLEVRQTLTSDLTEWSGGLCIRIRGTKTSHRDRVVPILPEFVPYIQQYMPAGEESLLNEAGEVTDPAIDKQLTKPIKIVAKQATVYSVRHGCRSLAIAYNVPDALQQALMGWSTQGGGRKQDRYGLSGRAYDEQMIAKADALSSMLQKVTGMLASKSSS